MSPVFDESGPEQGNPKPDVLDEIVAEHEKELRKELFSMLTKNIERFNPHLQEDVSLAKRVVRKILDQPLHKGWERSHLLGESYSPEEGKEEAGIFFCKYHSNFTEVIFYEVNASMREVLHQPISIALLQHDAPLAVQQNPDVLTSDLWKMSMLSQPGSVTAIGEELFLEFKQYYNEHRYDIPQ